MIRKILVICFVLILTAAAAKSAPDNTSASKNKDSDNSLLDFEKQGNFVYKADGRPDPFVPLLNKEGMEKNSGLSKKEEIMDLINQLKINGVLWDAQQPIVMINNKVYKKGDVVN